MVSRYEHEVSAPARIPSPALNPPHRLYKELIDAGEDLVELHALMDAAAVLVSGVCKTAEKLGRPSITWWNQHPPRPQESRPITDRTQDTRPRPRRCSWRSAFLIFLKHAHPCAQRANATRQTRRDRETVALGCSEGDWSAASNRSFLSFPLVAWSARPAPTPNRKKESGD